MQIATKLSTGVLGGITSVIILNYLLPPLKIKIELHKPFFVITGSILTSVCIFKNLNK